MQEANDMYLTGSLPETHMAAEIHVMSVIEPIEALDRWKIVLFIPFQWKNEELVK